MARYPLGADGVKVGPWWLIPLRGRDGRVRDWAWVDDADYAGVKRWRWSLDKGYAVRGQIPAPRQPMERIKMHRQLLGLGPGDRLECDHINRDRLDNRRCNLRAVTRAQNMQNKPAARGGRSRYRGVSWYGRTKKWAAKGRIDGVDYHVGYFASEDEAGRAAAAWRAENMPFSID